jgi:hypothetical protein
VADPPVRALRRLLIQPWFYRVLITEPTQRQNWQKENVVLLSKLPVAAVPTKAFVDTFHRETNAQGTLLALHLSNKLAAWYEHEEWLTQEKVRELARTEDLDLLAHKATYAPPLPDPRKIAHAVNELARVLPGSFFTTGRGIPFQRFVERHDRALKKDEIALYRNGITEVKLPNGWKW